MPFWSYFAAYRFSAQGTSRRRSPAEAETQETPDVYAIIEDGSHQYKVEEGQSLDVQRRDLDEGQTTIEFDKVMFVSGDEPQIGRPYLEGASVSATVQAELKGDKITIVKYRRRKDSRTKQGHRQRYLRVKIDAIKAGA